MSETKKNKGGRPRVDATPITLRLPPKLLELVDSYMKDQALSSRPEAIRRLLNDHFEPEKD